MLGRTNTGGGGAGGLNFKVICNPQPSTAKENTIWIDTDRINNYYFSATQPENMVEYDVWIITCTYSTVEFNALKKNGIQVYPLQAKQYIGSALVEKTAQSYQNGGWADWWNGELFDNGDKFEHITGGWVSGSWIFQSGDHSNGTVSINDTLKMTSNTGGSCKSVRTVNKIDLKDFSKLRITGSCGGHMKSIIISASSGGVVSFDIAPPSSGTIEVDISGYNGSYYIGAAARNGGYVTISKIQLVR